METNEALIEVCSTHSDPTLADPTWLEEAHGTVICTSCKQIRRCDYPRPVDVRLKRHNAGTVCGLTFWAGVVVFHRALIEQIHEYLGTFIIGRCYGMQGNLIEDYVTCYSRDYVVPRAGRGSRYTVCDVCGTVSDWGGERSPYILRRYLTGEKVLQDASCCMYLMPELAAQVDWSFFSHTELVRVPIREEPMDDQQLPGDFDGER